MVEDTFFQEYEAKIQEEAAEATVKAATEMAQYLIGKKWDAREIAEATKLDMDTVQLLFAQG
jgi:stress response protein SCP2